MNDCPKHLKLIERDLSGGKISIETINTIQDSNASVLTISGLRQDTLEYLVRNYGAQFCEIHFFKCPRVEDLSPLEDLDQLQKVSWFWNIKSERLWDLSRTSRLIELRLRDFNKLERLDDLGRSTSLQVLELDGGMWRKWRIDDLEPIASLNSLKEFTFSTKLKKRLVTPLSRLNSLEELHFPTNMFTTEQIAWLTAKIGDKVVSEVLAPYRDFSASPIATQKGDNLDALVIGSRKPFLDSKKQSERLERYVDKFEDLLKHYRINPDIPEPA